MFVTQIRYLKYDLATGLALVRLSYSLYNTWK